jgi:SHS2 domain-containing protein
MAPWEVLPHPTDLRVSVSGRDRRELFAEAARSVFALCARPRAPWPEPLETRDLHARGDDPAALLRRLLSDCLFEFESDGFLARDVEVLELRPDECRMRLRGGCFAPGELDVEHVIKAVTWHGLSLTEEPGAARAEILHDL